jgi:hypothetical protein
LSNGFRNLPVCDLSFFATCSGVPTATTSPPPDTTFRTEIDHMVRRLDHVEIVLDHEQAAAVVNQRAECGEKLVDVVEVQAGRSVRRR